MTIIINKKNRTGAPGKLPVQTQARIVISELTGLPVLVPPPGTPPLTSERVRKLLENFP
jgi:hypothetical protein